MKEFLSSPLFSVIVGAVLTLITTIAINRRDISNSLDMEIAKEKINAHKKIYKTICKLNHNLAPYDSILIPYDCFLGYIKANGEEYHKSFCFPSIFTDLRSLNTYKIEIASVFNTNRIFLEQPLINKVSFLDSYLGQICNILNDKNDSYVQMVGFVLSNEIDELVDDIELELQRFFNSDKKKNHITNYNDTYAHEFKERRKTDLYNWFINGDYMSGYGKFPLCLNCKSHNNCPLKKFLD